jgi:hypothetical protein
MKSLGWLRNSTWATAGFALGWLAVGWIGLSTNCHPLSIEAAGDCQIVKFFYDWQSLLAGFAAIGAALIGGNYILKQIQLSKEQAAERTRSRHAAARSMLPLALASITQYATECAGELKRLHHASQGNAVPKSALEAIITPTLPVAAIAELKPLVESSGEAMELAIADMLCAAQVLSSRLGSLKRPRDPATSTHTVVVHYLEAVIIDSLEVYARAASLFDYGRRKTHEVPAGPPTAKSLHSAMFNLGFFDDRFDDLRKQIDRRAERE